MTELIVNGERVRVSDDFLDPPPEEQERVVEEIAADLGSREREPFMSQFNLGVADEVGGAVDLLNPFDRPHALNPFPEGTGSARDGLVGVMQDNPIVPMAGEDREPEGLGEAMLRGGGQPAGTMVPFTAGARAFSAAPGLTGRVSGELARGMSTPAAVAAETAAGAVSGGAMEGTRQATDGSDLPEWARDALIGAAGVAAPIGLAGAMYATTRAPKYLPGATLARKGYEAAASTIAPYTRRGAEAVARRSVQELAGSRERAIEYGERINPNDEFGLTPAQQIGEQEFLSLEQMAAQDPNTRTRLDRRFAESMGLARQGLDEIGGDVQDAQRFFNEQRARYTSEMRAVADQAVRNANARLRGIEAERRPSENSRIVMEEIERARDAALAQEERLWQQVPLTVEIGTGRAQSVASDLWSQTPRAQRGDFPQIARQLLLDENGLGEATTVNELHGLYSQLRQVAREASAGQAPNRNKARIANRIAEAILEYLGAREGTDAAGQAINAARAFSRSLHETFDMGAYGRLSRETVQGDTVNDPSVALDRSVGHGDTGGMVDAENLETAAAGLGNGTSPPRPNERARNAIVDYVRGRFADSAFTPDARGNEVLNRRGAAQFIRNNRDLLERYPELRREILQAGDQQRTADEVAETIARRIEAIENGRTNPVSGFADASQEEAIRSILDAENPVRAAQAVRSAAQRDETGAAMAGVKAVFSDELIRGATRTQDGQTILDADRMREIMGNSRFRAAMNRILAPADVRRLERIVDVVERLNRAQTAQPWLGRDSLSGARAPRLMEMLIRIGAVNAAPTGGRSAGESLQIANMASSSARDILARLTADRASRIIADSLTDARLFHALLMDPASSRFEQEALPRLIPYLVGGGAATATPEDERSPVLRMELTDPGNQRGAGNQ